MYNQYINKLNKNKKVRERKKYLYKYIYFE